jgi:hypothetical protein
MGIDFYFFTLFKKKYRPKIIYNFYLHDYIYLDILPYAFPIVYYVRLISFGRHRMSI